MAEQEQILIEVKFDSSTVDGAKKALQENINALSANKKELADLNKQVKEGNALTEAGAKRYAQLNKDIEENKRAIKSNTAILQAATAARATENDSLDVQRQYVNTLQKAFAGLTAEQKEAMGGAEQLEKFIKSVSDSLVDQEHAIGENGRNVGNYAESMQKAFGEMAHAGELLSPAVSLLRGMGGEGKKAAAALDALSKVMQLAGKASKVLTTAQQAEKVATEGATVAQEGLNAAMSANPIGLIVAAISTLLPLVQSIISAFGDATDEIAAFNNELERQSNLIEQLQSDAAFEARIAGIIGASAQEQLRIRRDAAKKAVDIAQAEVDRLLEVKKNGSRKEKKAAEESYNEAVAQLQSAQKSLNAINQEATIQNLSDLKKAENEKKKIRDEAQQKKEKEQEEYNKRERELAVQQFDDLRILMEANQATLASRQQDLLEEARAALEAFDESEDEEPIPTKEEQAARLGLDAEGLAYFEELLQDAETKSNAYSIAFKDQMERNVGGVSKILHNIGNGFSALGDLMGEFADESEDAAAAQKAFTMIGILTNQAASISEGALALAKGVESAAAIPFPGNIPAIISITATISSLIAGVASSIAQAKQLFAQADSMDAGKYAQGGIVPGTSYTGDRLIAHVNSSEMILPQESQKVLFDALSSSENGMRSLGIDYGLLAETFKALPAPNMDYSEFKEFEKKVATYNEITGV